MFDPRNRFGLSILVVSFLSLGVSTKVQALNQPQKSLYDGRIRTISYNPDDVTQLDTHVGITTHIMLEPGETYITHAFGDSDAYAFAVNQHHLFLKPKAEQAHTNLVVVTNRRSYNFRLHCQEQEPHHNERHNKPQRTALYQLQFQYPDSELRRYRRHTEQAAIEQGFQHPQGPYNLEYTMCGDQDLAPLHVWDDGRFSYFKFNPHQDLPAIYMVDSDGQESLVNRHMTGKDQNIVVLHKVHNHWVLRLDEQVLALYNEVNNPQMPLPNTGTASPRIERQVKEPLEADHLPEEDY